MQPIEIRAKAFLSWLAEVEIPVDGGVVLGKSDLHAFRKHADQLWHAWFVCTWELGLVLHGTAKTGYDAFLEAVYADDDWLTRLDRAAQCYEQQGNLPSFAVHDPWELAYEPSRLASVRKALERMVATEEPPPAKSEEPKTTGSRNLPADDQIIAALNSIHKYYNGSVENHEPATVEVIAEKAGTVKSTVSKVFKRWGDKSDIFGDYNGYVRSCRTKNLWFHLKLLNREFGGLDDIDPAKIDAILSG